MAITINQLSKKYINGNVQALKEINATIPDGIFGLLGENGSGKSTLLRMLATVAPVQSGNIHIEEYDIVKDTSKIRSILGYLPQKFDFFEKLTVYEMLEYVAILKKIDNREKAIMEIIDEINLKDKTHSKISKLSGGMKQRVAIAQALIGNPKYIILDEPTEGLDPNERLRFREVISKRRNISNIIISTHIISDIAVLCENVGIMKKGKMVYCGTIKKLLEQIEGKIYIDIIKSNENIDIKKYKNVISILRKKDTIEVRFISEEDVSYEYAQVNPTLEDAYFYLTNIQ